MLRPVVARQTHTRTPNATILSPLAKLDGEGNNIYLLLQFITVLF